MTSLHNPEVTRQIAREHEATLLGRGIVVTREPGELRRWAGLQLVRAGTWLAGDRLMRPAHAR